MAAVVFLSSDMTFSSRVLGAAATLGIDCKIAALPAQLPGAVGGDCRLVLVDLGLGGLDLPAMVKAIRSASSAAKIVAFGPHVDEALLASAKAAGCDVVLPRSQFQKQYVELVRGAAGT
jgi:DNA-binding NarL/FixJ family response regulator